VNCVITPALTEGPYFVDEMLNRSDVRSDPTTGAISEGAPLGLTLTVSSVVNGACSPVAGAAVDIWHCDAEGAYSDVSGGAGQANTSGQKFLRGYQLTDDDGQVSFLTIFPGWYSGRTPHIHFKVRTEPESQQGTEFTSQFFFDEALTEQVYQRDPYASRGSPDTPNSQDNIFAQSGGDLTLALVEDGDGFNSRFHVGIG
jgi:protocatechuate 3,4-dioxygenase beta subunit